MDVSSVLRQDHDPYALLKKVLFRGYIMVFIFMEVPTTTVAP
jgi:hypothetical protein